jgi:2-dehydro-3-deoxygalactonokinase
MFDQLDMNTLSEKPTLIAIDWGTSNFRAFLLNAAGDILETRFAKRGLLHVPRGDFATVLQQQIGDCLTDNAKIPIVMSGMVGSKKGWQEAPYLMCPVMLDDLASGLQKVERQDNTWIVPGLRINYPDGRVDVMRGEETQILGCLASDIHTPQVFCLPGTHSKWAWVEAGKLQRFTTFMTGEIFNLLFKHSILGKSTKHPHLNIRAFYQGIEWAERPESLLSQLFQVRTQMLAENLATEDIHSFLSGLLIGHELSSVFEQNSRAQGNALDHVSIVANRRVSQLYAKAITKHQLQSVVMDIEQVTAKGIFKIAQQAGLIPSSTL